jgi:hypothetical protein
LLRCCQRIPKAKRLLRCCQRIPKAKRGTLPSHSGQCCCFQYLERRRCCEGRRWGRFSRQVRPRAGRQPWDCVWILWLARRSKRQRTSCDKSFAWGRESPGGRVVGAQGRRVLVCVGVGPHVDVDGGGRGLVGDLLGRLKRSGCRASGRGEARGLSCWQRSF